jgi:hypothetical protein
LSAEEREVAKLQLLCELKTAIENLTPGGGAINVFEFDRSWDQDVTLPFDSTSFFSNVPGYADLTADLDSQGYSAAKRTQIIDALNAGKYVRVGFGAKIYFEASPPVGTEWFTIKFGGTDEKAPRYVAVCSMQAPPDPGAFYLKFGFNYEMWFDGFYKFRNVSMYQEALFAADAPPGFIPIEAAVTADSTDTLPSDAKFYLTTYGAEPTAASLLYIERTNLQILDS